MPEYPVSFDFTIPDLNVKAHLTGTVTWPEAVAPPPPPTPPPPPEQQPGPIGLADRVMGVYFPHWEPRRLKDRPAEINTVFLAFAIGRGEGAVEFAALNTLDRNEFVSDIQNLRSRGIAVILSVGGEGSPISLGSEAQVSNFMESVDRIYRDWGGFDGLDWDVEAPTINPTWFASASRKLKQRYGKSFAISMSFAGPNQAYKQLAQELEQTGDIDLVVIQYYDYQATQEERRSGVMSRTSELTSTYGVKQSHIGVGVKFAGDDSMVWTVPSILTMWKDATRQYPSLRGIIVWDSLSSSQIPAGQEFLTSVAPAVAPPGARKASSA